MSRKCTIHPARDSTRTAGGLGYCSVCVNDQNRAARSVNQHVEPTWCFVWYTGRAGWRAIPGTGCAHWVAHQKGYTTGRSSGRCLAGCLLRVSDLMDRLVRISDLARVRVGDVFVNERQDHCGIVARVLTRPGGTPEFVIEHDSSRQGGVSLNRWSIYFDGKGGFYRGQ